MISRLRKAAGSAAKVAGGVAVATAQGVGDVFSHAGEDLDAAVKRDPATPGRFEMALASSGLHALWLHRVAHRMWQADGGRLPARLLSQANRFATGIEIHPGATIGRRVFIDHGMGVVIGETATVGDDVMMYHGVLLGGVANDTSVRHPQVADGVLLGAGAKLLGPIEIGAGSKVGAGAVVVNDLPPGVTAVGPKARVIVKGPKRAMHVVHGKSEGAGVNDPAAVEGRGGADQPDDGKRTAREA